MALVLDGSLGVTFPVTAGSASAVQASSGRVLQVVQTFSKTYTHSTSTSYTDVGGLSCSITPSSTTSKVLVSIQINGLTNGVATTTVYEVFLQLTDGSGSLITPLLDVNVTGGTGGYQSYTTTYLHSPATTSAITYKVQGKGDASSHGVDVNNYTSVNNTYSSITLMEIAA